MPERLLETLTGTGGIYAGDALLRTTAYRLSLWSHDEPGGAGADPGGAARIDGHIDITGIAEAVVLTGPDGLTLMLDDGRRLAIQLTSSGGSIIGRGWLQRA